MSCSDFRQLSQMNKQIIYAIRTRASETKCSYLNCTTQCLLYFLRTFLAVVFASCLERDIKVISARRKQV